MTNQERIELCQIRLNKANESYAIAEEIYEKHPSFSVNRYYYALFYASGSALLAQSVENKSHKGAVNAFHQHLVNGGPFEVADGKFLSTVFQMRSQSDYEDRQEYTLEEVEAIREPVLDLLNRLIKYATKAIENLAPASPP